MRLNSSLHSPNLYQRKKIIKHNLCNYICLLRFNKAPSLQKLQQQLQYSQKQFSIQQLQLETQKLIVCQQIFVIKSRRKQVEVKNIKVLREITSNQQQIQGLEAKSQQFYIQQKRVFSNNSQVLSKHNALQRFMNPRKNTNKPLRTQIHLNERYNVYSQINHDRSQEYKIMISTINESDQKASQKQMLNSRIKLKKLKDIYIQQKSKGVKPSEKQYRQLKTAREDVPEPKNRKRRVTCSELQNNRDKKNYHSCQYDNQLNHRKNDEQYQKLIIKKSIKAIKQRKNLNKINFHEIINVSTKSQIKNLNKSLAESKRSFAWNNVKDRLQKKQRVIYKSSQPQECNLQSSQKKTINNKKKVYNKLQNLKQRIQKQQQSDHKKQEVKLKQEIKQRKTKFTVLRQFKEHKMSTVLQSQKLDSGNLDIGQVRVRSKTNYHINNPQHQMEQKIKQQTTQYKKQIINYGKFLPILPEQSLNQKNSAVKDYTPEMKIMCIKGVLGVGAHAEVKQAECFGNKFAIKIYQKTKISSKSKKQMIYSQIKILNQIPKHPNIISLIQAYQNKSQIHLIFQYVEKAKTLKDYFESHNCILSEKQIKQIFYKIVKAVVHLHNHGVSHRDLKPSNIIIGFDQDMQMILKIIDFGSSTNKIKSELHCGTPNFLAPQLIDKNRSKQVTLFAADVWALGIILFYIVQGRYPFRGHFEFQLYNNIKNGFYQFSRISKYNIKIQSIIADCLQLDYNKRISVQELSRNQWFLQ